jgi:hypothetical protein
MISWISWLAFSRPRPSPPRDERGTVRDECVAGAGLVSWEVTGGRWPLLVPVAGGGWPACGGEPQWPLPARPVAFAGHEKRHRDSRGLLLSMRRSSPDADCRASLPRGLRHRRRAPLLARSRTTIRTSETWALVRSNDQTVICIGDAGRSFVAQFLRGSSSVPRLPLPVACPSPAGQLARSDRPALERTRTPCRA